MQTPFRFHFALAPRLFLPALTVLLAASCGSLLSPAVAQNEKSNSVSTHSTQDAFANEPVVVEHYESVNTFAADGTGTVERTMALRIQSDAALRTFGVLTLPYASASEHVEIVYARVKRRDGSVISSSAADALDQPDPVTVAAPFYSDLKQKQLPIKGLQVGDTLEWKARIVRTKPEAPGEFWGQESFNRSFVVLSERTELHFPATATVTVWTNPQTGVQPTSTVVDGQKIYRWQTSNLTPTVGAQADAENLAKKKRLLTAADELDTEQGALPSLAWTTFPNWAAVGEWYRSLSLSRAAPTAAIQAKVAELTAGKTTEEEKARAVYAYVSAQLRYIGVAFGTGRLQPHSAEDVLDNQYGDCKDKHTLLAAMLSSLGLHPEAVLIGAGIRFNPAVPSPAAFNHLITRVPINGKEVWLDSTAEVAPWQLLSFSIRDRQALVIPASGAPNLAQTPADPPDPSFVLMHTVGSIDEHGVSESQISFSLNNDAALLYRQILRQIPPSQYDQAAQRFSQGIGYGSATSHAEFTPINDPSLPLTISYHYHNDRDTDWINMRFLAQLAPVGLPVVDAKEPPVGSILLGVPRTEDSTAEMKIPDGWAARLPEAVHQKTPFATYDETFRFDHQTVYAERKLVVLQRKIPASDWKSYKDWTDAISMGNDTYVVLFRGAEKPGKEKTAASLTSPSQTPASPTEASESAARLIQQSFDEMNLKHDLPAATQLLDQAAQLNPNQKDLAGARGALAYNHGEMSAAIVEYKKELASYPDSVWVYPPLVRSQLLTGHDEDAIASLKGWALAASSDPTPTVMLADILIKDGKFESALKTVQDALTQLPPNSAQEETLRLALGNAQIKAGHQADATITYLALAQSSKNPLTLNDSAYALAEAKVDLPAAEGAARNAVATLTDETQTWTLDEQPELLTSKSRLLIAAWDTLGWVLHAKGKEQDALAEVEPAWRNNPGVEGSRHLAAIDTALGDKAGALAASNMAEEATPMFDAMGVRSKAGRLQAKAQAARPVRGQPAQSASTTLRTYPLGDAHGRYGVAEYILLLSNGKVERARPTGTKELSGGTALLEAQHLAGLFPPDSQARLVRKGILNCANSQCALILEP